MNPPPKVAGVILAAGISARLGRTKQLLPFRGQTILEGVVDSALASALQQVVVVLGHQAEALVPLMAGKNVALSFNPDYLQGQSSSLKVGLELVSAEAEAVLFLLGDQPLVTPEIINLILAAYQASPHPIVLPVFNGERGNPVLFSRETFGRLASLKDDRGARPLFADYAGRLLKLPVADPAILFDIDTEEDYQRLLRLDQR
jgi:molybdenum cofactor cytidylyltransferase